MSYPDFRHALGTARVDELVKAADGFRRARRARGRGPGPGAAAIEIRGAHPSDAGDLARLAALDAKPAPQGRVLVASVDGVVRAAVGEDGRGVGDPFVPTAALLDLLRIRARQLATR